MAILEAIIDETGRVRNVKVLREPACPEFMAAQIAAVQQWRFKPARKDGVPVAVYLTFMVNIDYY